MDLSYISRIIFIKRNYKRSRKLILIDMPNKIKDTIEHFDIREVSRNYFEVTYTSPITGRSWTQITDDKKLINQAKEGVNLLKLKFICKI
jgi:hypothetical protein